MIATWTTQTMTKNLDAEDGLSGMKVCDDCRTTHGWMPCTHGKPGILDEVNRRIRETQSLVAALHLFRTCGRQDLAALIEDELGKP